MVVIDASALMRASVKYQGTQIAVRAIESADLVAPDIISIEVANALRRYVRAGEMDRASAETLLDAARSLMRIVPVSTDLLAEAFRLACEMSHPVYDCIYVALALHDRCGLVTADLKMASVARKLHIATELIP